LGEEVLKMLEENETEVLVNKGGMLKMEIN
jgi:hypothetical protein